MPFTSISSDEYDQYHQQMNAIFRKLPSLIQALTLTLPAKTNSIYKKIQQFSQIQHVLEHDLNVVVGFTQRGYPTSYHELSDRLIRLLEDLLEYTDTLLHLAQEYPIDPTGTTQCLIGIVVDDAQFLREVSHLQIAIARLSIPQHWGQSLRQAGQSIRNAVSSLSPSALN